MPGTRNGRFVFHPTHTAELPDKSPALGPHVRRRLPKRDIVPRRLAIGSVEGRPGVGLMLMQDDGRSHLDIHPDLGLAVGQAELEFGVPPSAWMPLRASGR